MQAVDDVRARASGGLDDKTAALSEQQAQDLLFALLAQRQHGQSLEETMESLGLLAEQTSDESSDVSANAAPKQDTEPPQVAALTDEPHTPRAVEPPQCASEPKSTVPRMNGVKVLRREYLPAQDRRNVDGGAGSLIGRLWLPMCLAFALFYWAGATWFFPGVNPNRESAIETTAIENVRVGDRSPAKNPLREQVDPNVQEPDPATWRKLCLHMTKENGYSLWIKLLRPDEWIVAHGAEVGGAIFLDLEEMGAFGEATVTYLGPCPPIKPGTGAVITGTFRHEASPDQKILRVTFANGAVLPGVTDNHPIFSVDQNDFVPIGGVRQGELVKADGRHTRVARIVSRFARPGEMLHNLEVHGEHVYQVTEAGILVHNNCITGSIRGKPPNKVAQDILSREPTWKKIPADRGRGWKIIDGNGTERMRYMYPQKTGFPHERAGYFVRQDAQGRFLDIDGSVIPDGDLQITLRHIFDSSP